MMHVTYLALFTCVDPISLAIGPVDSAFRSFKLPMAKEHLYVIYGRLIILYLITYLTQKPYKITIHINECKRYRRHKGLIREGQIWKLNGHNCAEQKETYHIQGCLL